MTQDITPLVRSWLEQTPAAVPEPVHLYPSVAAQVHQTPQQRGFLPPLTGRFKPMFSATKFVVGGVIVALFGGFLLSGVLTQQGEESAPAVGASASASPEIRSDILPGVDLATEELGPRLVRVLGDGEHAVRRNIKDVAVAPNGDVWVMRQNGTVYRLGEPGNAFQQRHRSFRLRGDGTLWVGDRRLEGEDWVNGKPYFCQRGRLAADGTCWATQIPGQSGVLRHFDKSSPLDSGSLDGYPGFRAGPFAVATDGTVWTTLSRNPFAGLASYDGSTWTPFETDALEGFVVGGMAVAPDGVVWMSFFVDGGGSWLAMSWDGEAWATYGPLDGFIGGSIDFLPDGSPWFGRVAELVGDELRPIEVLAPIGDGTAVVNALANAADGSVWLVVNQPDDEGGGLYVITPEAVTATE